MEGLDAPSFPITYRVTVCTSGIALSCAFSPRAVLPKPANIFLGSSPSAIPWHNHFFQVTALPARAHRVPAPHTSTLYAGSNTELPD